MTAAGVAPVTISCAGRLGRDPEARQTSGGKDMALASLAVDLPAGKDADPETWWLSLMAFGRAAGELAKHRKGDRLAVMGHLQRGRFKGRDGESRESWTLICDSILGPRSARPSGGKRPDNGAGQSAPPVADPAPDPAPGPVPGDRARQDPPPFDDGIAF